MIEIKDGVGPTMSALGSGECARWALVVNDFSPVYRAALLLSSCRLTAYILHRSADAVAALAKAPTYQCSDENKVYASGR